MIGINDLIGERGFTQIMADYERLVSAIKEKSPITKLYIQSILPVNNAQDSPKASSIMAVNEGLISLSKKHRVTFVNLFDLLKTTNNKLDEAYSFDGLHLNGKGYLVWKKAIEDFVNN